MARSVIHVSNLSKAYRIGLKEEIPDTLTSALLGWVRRPLHNFRRLRRLNTFSTNGHSQADDIIWALRDVSFEIAEGEVIGIIGRNGAGKSTLLKILSRITEPTSGRATIRGRVSSLLEVGTGFHPELSGRENIYMNGTILGMTKREIDRKFDEIVDFSGVERFLDTPIKRYSSGMQVRLAFSVAAHLEPEILIVDEVLAVGDQAFQQKCMGRMQNISQLGRTVLFVSHNMSAIQNLCQRVVMLDAGRVSYIGAADAGIKFYVDGVGQEDDAEIELARHPSRRTNCRPLLQRLRLLQHSGEATSRFKCGEPIILELSLDAAPELADIHCWIQVHDELGTRLFTVSTELSDTAPLGLKMPMQALCRIDELPLTPGSYFLTLLAGPIGERATDAIDRAACVRVLETDYYGNGRRPNSSRGHFLVRSTWSTRNAVLR